MICLRPTMRKVAKGDDVAGISLTTMYKLRKMTWRLVGEDDLKVG